MDTRGQGSSLWLSTPRQPTELALALPQGITGHQFVTLGVKIPVHVTGVVPVSWLDPAGHGISGLECLFSCMEGRKSCDASSKECPSCTDLGTHSGCVLQLGFQNVTLHVVGDGGRQKRGLKGLLGYFFLFSL